MSPPGGDEGGGEYTTQIGFGWTNGVLVALTSLYPTSRRRQQKQSPNNARPS
jgi:neutral trehalase